MHVNKSLKVALLFSAMGDYSVQLLGFVSIMIVARLLSPNEVGVFAVAGSTMVIAIELSSFGVGQFLIREKNINEDMVRSVLGMAVMVSWGLGILLVLAAPYIADFYDKAAVKNLLWILSISFFLMPFFSIPVALWKREMLFGKVSILKLTGQLVTTVSSISLILQGFSYYGLAIGAAMGMIARLTVAMLLKPPGTVWIPRFTLVNNLLRFGVLASLTNVFVRFSEGIPDLVIGKVSSMADVGYFSRGLGAVLFLNKILVSAVASVVLPHLADIKRAGGSVADAYLRSVKLLLAFTLPVFAVAGAASYPMIIGLFGDQWGAAVPIASILAIWIMIVSVHSFSASAFIVSGGEKLMFVTALINAVSRLVLVLLAASHGLEMVAWGIVLSGVIELCVNTLALKRTIGMKITKLVAAVLPNLFIAFGCWLATVLIDRMVIFKEVSPYQSIAIIAICLPIVWMFLLRITRHEAWDLIWDILSNIKKRVLIKVFGPSAHE
ncbi:MAG TPA: hypothetical protein ENJ08_19960 [Gammaproteobacteria bacterium]|nr:hypothetical protein [Gammaproteobacteria bacterium]